MLEQGNLITLKNNKRYTIVDSKYVGNDNYLCLIDQDDFYNLMFCKYNSNNTLTEVKDEMMISKLTELFSKSLNKEETSYGYSIISIISILTALVTVGIIILGVLIIK